MIQELFFDKKNWKEVKQFSLFVAINCSLAIHLPLLSPTKDSEAFLFMFDKKQIDKI